MRILFTSAMLAAGFTSLLPAQMDKVPRGTDITVRTDQAIDARYPSDSRIYRGSVERDVLDRGGKIAIPRGAPVELILRDVSDRELVVDLESIVVNGQRYSVDTKDEVVSGDEHRREGVGANKRTGKYVGGGAILGSIIGAIAGGGKGAAIGAAAGAGAGAVGQSVTRGGYVRLPAESLVSFRLEHGLTIGPADDGFDREGHHYHRYERPER